MSFQFQVSLVIPESSAEPVQASHHPGEAVQANHHPDGGVEQANLPTEATQDNQPTPHSYPDTLRSQNPKQPKVSSRFWTSQTLET